MQDSVSGACERRDEKCLRNQALIPSGCRSLEFPFFLMSFLRLIWTIWIHMLVLIVNSANEDGRRDVPSIEPNCTFWTEILLRGEVQCRHGPYELRLAR